jgi:tRNA A-37 threonylcarbamoyl transferase component Bud32
MYRFFLEEVGSALAALHLERIYLDPTNSDIRKLRTCIHGDLHSNNIFFDLKMLQVTFIDSAGIGASWLDPKSPELDFFLMMRSLQMEISSKELKYLKFSRMCEAFFKGYKSKVPGFLHPSIDEVISDFTALSSRVTPKLSLSSEH